MAQYINCPISKWENNCLDILYQDVVGHRLIVVNLNCKFLSPIEAYSLASGGQLQVKVLHSGCPSGVQVKVIFLCTCHGSFSSLWHLWHCLFLSSGTQCSSGVRETLSHHYRGHIVSLASGMRCSSGVRDTMSLRRKRHCVPPAYGSL